MDKFYIHSEHKNDYHSIQNYLSFCESLHYLWLMECSYSVTQSMSMRGSKEVICRPNFLGSELVA